MKRASRIALWSLIVLLALGATLLLVLLLAGGGLIKTAVNRFGPGLLGVPVHLEQVELNPIRGHARLHGLYVGNPPGFASTGLLAVADAELDLHTGSLFADTIRIRRLVLKAPQFTYDRGENGSNLDTVLQNLGVKKKKKGETPPDPKPGPAPAPKPGKKERKFIIDEVRIEDPKLQATVSTLGGLSATVDLGPMELRDIGKAEGGVTMKEALKTITVQLTAKIEANVEAVTGSFKQSVDTIKDQTQGVVDAVKSLFGGDKKKKDKDKK